MVAQVCPTAKFILFLRDPVKRAYSSWNMQVLTVLYIVELDNSQK